MRSINYIKKIINYFKRKDKIINPKVEDANNSGELYNNIFDWHSTHIYFGDFANQNKLELSTTEESVKIYASILPFEYSISSKQSSEDGFQIGHIDKSGYKYIVYKRGCDYDKFSINKSIDAGDDLLNFVDIGYTDGIPSPTMNGLYVKVPSDYYDSNTYDIIKDKVEAGAYLIVEEE